MMRVKAQTSPGLDTKETTMPKFDVYQYLKESILNELDQEQDPQMAGQMGAPPGQQGQDPAADPNAQAQEPAPTEQEPTPQQTQQEEGVKSPFVGLTGETIKDMEFRPTPNGGSIIIKTDSPLPFIFSWEGDSVTIKHRGITKLR